MFHLSLVWKPLMVQLGLDRQSPHHWPVQCILCLLWGPSGKCLSTFKESCPQMASIAPLQRIEARALLWSPDPWPLHPATVSLLQQACYNKPATVSLLQQACYSEPATTSLLQWAWSAPCRETPLGHLCAASLVRSMWPKLNAGVQMHPTWKLHQGVIVSVASLLYLPAAAARWVHQTAGHSPTSRATTAEAAWTASTTEWDAADYP